jgi:biotin synthase
LFDQTRGKAARGPHDWDRHWEIILAARRIFGAMKVNCHIIVGLGETDRDLVDLFYQLKDEGIAGYLFSFNPEPGSAMQNMARQPIRRWRRVQLAKYLIENTELRREAIAFDDQGYIAMFDLAGSKLEVTVRSGLPFMTNGCPNREGTLACNRPYGSYRPGDEFRDYPFVPDENDLALIREQLRLEPAGRDA